MLAPLLIAAMLSVPDDPLLDRLVRHDSFEDAAVRPVQMPEHYHRFGGTQGAAARGFPRWGTIALTDEHAWSGDWSLGFTLEGGSLAARIPSGVVPALPRSNYQVSVRVRTEGLTHAAARLVAWRYGRDGDPVPGSVRMSEPIRTAGRWATLSVLLDAKTAGGVDVGVDLQLIQPRQRGDAALDAIDTPQAEDFTGRAWFDDLTIWHLPHIDLNCVSPTGVFTAPQVPAVDVAVHDLIEREPDARLEVIDTAGRTVLSRELATGPMRRVELSDLPYGWYRVTVRIRCDHGVEAVKDRDLVLLPPANEDGIARGFGVEIGDPDEHTADLLARLNGGIVVLTARDRNHGPPPGLLDMLDRLDTELVVAIDQQGRSDMEMTSLLLGYGELVDLWQIGPTEAEPGVAPVSERTLAATGTALRRVLPDARIVLPWPAERAPHDVAGADGHHLVIPAAASPAAVTALAAAWTNPTLASLRRLEQDTYSRSAQVTDLLHRTLAAWRAGLPRLVIAAPWRVGTPPRPEPIYGVWRQISRQLTGVRHLGDVDLGPGVTAWIVGPETPTSGRDITLVAWSNRDGTVETTAHLGAGTVHVVDAFGNRQPAETHDDLHVLRLTETPVFIEGVDANIARFRSAFTIEPPQVVAEHRVHEHVIVLTNPWPVRITGSVHLSAGAIEISPRNSTFQIPPGQTKRIPVTLVPSRSLVAGPVELEGRFEIDAPLPHRFHALTRLEVGLTGVTLNPRWQLDESGIAILVEVTNTGTTPREFEAFLHAPGVIRRRRAIGRLAPGETSIRQFTLTNDEAIRGSTVYVGVDEPARGARLMEAMAIPF